ncbi:MAG: hypothetical protein ACMVO3_25135 [Thalassobaculum sp.]
MGLFACTSHVVDIGGTRLRPGRPPGLRGGDQRPDRLPLAREGGRPRSAPPDQGERPQSESRSRATSTP